MKRFVLSVMLVSLVLWTGCSDDDPKPTPVDIDVVEDTTPSEDAEAIEDTTPAEEIEVSEPGFDPWEAVPAVKREADPATACPTAFVDGPLGGGQYEGYEVSYEVTDDTGTATAMVENRSFVLAVPDAEVHEGPRPLMILFNGTNGTGQGAYDKYNGADWLNAGFIVLAPDSIGHGYLWPSWDAMLQVGGEDGPNPDLAYFDSLLECATGHLNIDANRIYAAGHSAGGIMTNFIVQRRSNILAGAIVASGIFDLTAPNPDISMEPVAVLVTWGGDNDSYSGDSESDDVAVPEVNFVEQASIASIHYEETDGVHQVHCKGNDLEHAYLSGDFDLMHDFLIHHPKGLTEHENWNLDDAPAPVESVCSEDAYIYVPPVVSECDDTAEPSGCLAFCQLVADCVVENSTVAPVLGPALSAMGFSGDDMSECGGCLTTCADDAAAGGDLEVPVLACFEGAAAAAECGSGIPGAMPAIDAINGCCVENPDSHVCTRACEAALLVSVAKPFFEEGCAAWIIDCTTEGEACAEDAECCSGDCGDDGLCAAAPEPPPCAEEGEACSDDDDCCTGDCGEGDLCVAAPTPPGGQCDNEADLEVVATKDIDAIAGDSALACLSDPENTEACVEATLMSEDVGLSAGCAGCYSALVTCSVENCIVECVNPNPDGGPLGDECTCCRDENGCTDAFYACSGLVDDNPAPDCEVEPEPPTCAADGEACADDADCCAGVCGAGGVCEVTPEPPTCAADGEACADDIDCCAGVCGAGGTCEAAPVEPAGACDNESDLAVVASKDVDTLAGEAGLACLSDPENTEACVESALTADDVGLTSDCAGCYSALVTCSVENCIVECANPDPDGGPLGDECTCCRDENGCTDAFYSCSGLVDDNPAPNCEPAP